MYATKKRKPEEVKESENASERKKKCVSFTPGIKEDNSNFAPLSRKKREETLHHVNSFKSLWLTFADAKEFEQLKQSLDSYKERRNFAEFFELKGKSILNSALSTPTTGHLYFIRNNVPQELLQATLSEQDYRLIDDFLHRESCIEPFTPMGNEYLSNRLEKIKLLLCIDPEDIKEKLKATYKKAFISSGVKTSIAQALKAEGASLPASPLLTFAYETFPPTPPFDCEAITPPASPPSPDEEITPPASPPLI